jgi:hypothetical protein
MAGEQAAGSAGPLASLVAVVSIPCDGLPCHLDVARSTSPHQHDDGHDYHNEHYRSEAYVHTGFLFPCHYLVGTAKSYRQ